MAQKLQNHLRCWFLIMLTQHAAIQNATSTLEHLPAQPEPSLGGGLGDSISDGEPTACQVPDNTLDKGEMPVVFGYWFRTAVVWNFHDVTVVDIGDLPESQVSIPELSELARRWPPAVITHMRWRQPELEETAGGVRVLWHHDQVRYVPACGTLPLGVGSVVEVPGFVVHRLEGRATGFDGPCSWIPQSAGGSPTHQVRNTHHTALDGDTTGVYGLADVASLRDIE